MGLQHLSRQLARRVMERCDALGEISDDTDGLTRTFLSPAMRRANERVGDWMRAAGLEAREDAVRNLIGRFPSANPKAKTLLLGSHLDTVRNAGKYDGPLGVLVALASMEALRTEKITLPFHVEIIGFADEEGVRYQSTYLGSRALAGTLTAQDLARTDEHGIALRDSGIGDVASARRNRRDLIGYAEVHIEQGPVLEAERLPVGVVTAISGQTRARLEFIGEAGHAGTTPMKLRKDALCAAAEFVVAVEKLARGGLVATVGQLEVKPGASNVIPAKATLSLDVRHQRDDARLTACADLQATAQRIAKKRGLRLTWMTVQQTRTVECDGALTDTFKRAVAQNGLPVLTLPSGAGHDAAAMSKLCPAAMLFICCKRGLSHHPDESVKESDVARAIAVLVDFLLEIKLR